jgi:endonuclease YncB( thermonuclease family)
VRLLLALLLLLVFAAPAAAVRKAPCRPAEPKGPQCLWWPAKVRAVDDGDTLKVHVPGRRGKLDVRVTGINAMELTRYSHTPSRRRGACHSLEAAAFVDQAVRGSRRRVRLAAQHAGSRSGRRVRRSVWVRQGGHWVDLAQLELEAGLALWLPNNREWAHNRQYEELAAAALGAGTGLYDPDACGAGPDDDVPLSLRVNWDANGPDGKRLNGEYVDIRNGGTRPVSLAGWWFRDSALRARRGVPGYPFPGSAVVPAGGSLRLHVGCGDNGAAAYFWCLEESVFENVTRRRGSGDGGYLFDPDGDLRAARMYPCVRDCHDPLRGPIVIGVRAKAREAITLTNRGPVDLDLGDHVLKLRWKGVPARYVFGRTFPRGSILGAGQSYTYFPKGGHQLADRGGVVELRSDDNILTACDDWGWGDCLGPPKRGPGAAR